MLVQVAVDQTQMPRRVREDLRSSLRARSADHKFHYDSVKQTQKWLQLHETYSPARTDPDCAAIYATCFEAAIRHLPPDPHVLVVSLGCGGGQKDLALIEALQRAGKTPAYLPCDVSLAMTLVARETAMQAISGEACFPLVCDIGKSEDLGQTLRERVECSGPRVLTFFGVIPNFEPDRILGRLAGALAPGETLLFSANLAPGSDYEQGVKRVLPQYDNPLTVDWLMTFLVDLGVSPADGTSRFVIEPDPNEPGLLRIAAYFHFQHDRKLAVDGEEFSFQAGEDFRLFFSYRYTPTKLRSLLARHGLAVEEDFITRSGEEGVFLTHRSS